MKKWLIYTLIPLNLLLLLICPRFGWQIHYEDASVIPFREVFVEDGAVHTVYGEEEKSVSVAYSHPLSRSLDITVNGVAYCLEVAVDGCTVREEPKLPPFIGSDLIWQDACGIFGWRYIAVIALTCLSVLLFKKAKGKKLLYICGIVSGIVPFLLAIRLF